MDARVGELFLRCGSMPVPRVNQACVDMSFASAIDPPKFLAPGGWSFVPNAFPVSGPMALVGRAACTTLCQAKLTLPLGIGGMHTAKL